MNEENDFGADAAAVDETCPLVPANQLPHVDPWFAPLNKRRREILAGPHGMACGGNCSTCVELSRIEAALRTIAKYNEPVVDHDAIHNWFELTYAQYLTIPRSVLQSMPDEWQSRFVRCLNELDEAIDWRPAEGCYRVELRALRDKKEDGQWVSGWGRLLRDPLRDYQRGRRRVPLKIATGNPASSSEIGSVPSAAYKDGPS